MKSPMPDGKALYKKYAITSIYKYRGIANTSVEMTKSYSDGEDFLLSVARTQDIEKGYIAYSLNPDTGKYSFTIVTAGAQLWQYTFSRLCQQRCNSSNWYNLCGGKAIPKSNPSELWDTATMQATIGYGNDYSLETVTITCNKFVSQKYLSSQTRGDYIETLLANEGAYPDDGISGSYWYVRVA